MNNIADIIAQIKGEVNLLDLLQRHGLDPKKTGRQYQCLCPFHDEKTPSFTINISKGYFKCFGCDWSGDAVNFVKEFTKVDTIDACKELISMYGLNIQLDENKPEVQKIKTDKKPTKSQSNPKVDYLLLPHLELATFPEDYKVVFPSSYKSKALTKEDKELGAKYKMTTPYTYSFFPCDAYKLKIELFNDEGIRIKKYCEWWHKNSVNDHIKGKGDYKGNCYRIADAVEFGKGKIIAVCEGEKDVETLRKLGIIAISFDSSDFTQLSEIDCDGFLVFGDNDEVGKTKLEKVVKACSKLNKPCFAVLITTLWVDAPEKSDITDYIEAFEIERDDLIQKLSAIVFPNGATIASDRPQIQESSTPFEVGDFVQINPEISDKGAFYKNLTGKKLKITAILKKSVYLDTEPPSTWQFKDLIPWSETIEVENPKTETTEAINESPGGDAPAQDESPAAQPEENAKTDAAKGISFAKTLKQLVNGKKTATRRIWADSTAKIFTKYFEEGVLIPALSKDRRYGGQEIGKIKLVAPPFKQSLKLMTANDLVKEGFPTLSVKQFCDRFFDGNSDQEAWVVEFEFFPNQETQEQQEPQTISEPIRLELSDEEREQFYTEEAINELFMDGHYCSISGKLYKFIDTHYQEVDEATEKRRIANWLRKYSHKLATRDKVSNVWDWVLIRFGVNPDEINPSGLNLLNGVLEVTWDDHNCGSVRLKPHSPKTIFTYVSEVVYDPDADSQDCDRLLSCLEPSQQKIFLRTIASSLDLGFVRKHQGRIRALLLSGKGNNGKDTLREVTQLLLSEGMTDATLGDFQQYDNGRKFPLSKLHGKLISWASENSALNRLDALQSLKAAITGDPISIEFKQQEEFSIKPKTIFIFNANEPPQIKTGLEAMKSRWAVINFKKTYSDRPNKALGELQADPRFKNDPDFLKQKIAPAFLNRIIDELQDLAINGIDYAPVQEAFEDLRKESNHLYQFCSDMGIDYVENGKIYICDLWQMLRDWYITNGTLEIEVSDRGKEKQIWHDQPKKGDNNVKAQNQIYKRFLEIFPNITKHRETVCEEDKGKNYLQNIGQIASLASLAHESSVTASPLLHCGEAVGEATPLVSQGSEASEANYPYFSKVKNDLVKLDLQQKIDLILQILTPQELPTFENLLKSQIVRWGYNSTQKFKIGDKVFNPTRPHEQLVVIEVDGEQVRVQHPYGKEWLLASDIQLMPMAS